MREYGVDMYDVLTGKVAPRRVLALLRGLPTDSKTQQALRAHAEGAELTKYFGWGTTEILLSNLFNSNELSRFNFAKAHGGKPSKPKLVEVPTATENKRPQRTGLQSLRHRALRDAGDY